AKSSSNRTDREQKIGLLLEWNPDEKLFFSESVLAEAKKGEFHFVNFYQDPVDRPRYSRALSSDFSGAWLISPNMQLKGSWSVKYSDDGFWYGRDYMDTAIARDSSIEYDYYAIASKSIYYIIDLNFQLRHRNIIAELGNVFTDTYDRSFESGAYIVKNDKGYTTKPYLNLNLDVSESLVLSSHLSYSFVVGQGALGYWDFRLQVEGRL
ncbi:MAG: hypothetical protein ACLFVQ_13930, partial [Chitinispirillaceae bacterium]